MNFQELSDRKAVLNAIAEFDSLGREVFLERYGFGKARTFLLIYKGKLYDSKAIVGRAYGYQFPTRQPLKATEFYGGKATVVPKLKELGFKVIALGLDEKSAAFAEEVPNSLWEGARRSITVNSFERNPTARLACIEAHGTTCAICNFDFGLRYGAEFQGFIHVHHLVPLASIDSRYKVNPTTDLLPVCPNCHAVLHYGGKIRIPSQVKALLDKANQK